MLSLDLCFWRHSQSYNYFAEKNVQLSFDLEKHNMRAYFLYFKFGLCISSKKNVKSHSFFKRWAKPSFSFSPPSFHTIEFYDYK